MQLCNYSYCILWSAGAVKFMLFVLHLYTHADFYIGLCSLHKTTVLCSVYSSSVTAVFYDGHILGCILHQLTAVIVAALACRQAGVMNVYTLYRPIHHSRAG